MGVVNNDKNTEIPLAPLTLAELRRVYRHFDANNDGLVDQTEVKRMMDHATKTYSGKDMPSPDTDADGFVALLDTDKDGTISEAEFIAFLELYRGYDHEDREEFGTKSKAHQRIGVFVQQMIVVAREKYGADRNAGTYRLNRQTAMGMIGHADTLEEGPCSWWHCVGQIYLLACFDMF